VCRLLLSPEQQSPAHADAGGHKALWAAAEQGHTEVSARSLAAACTRHACLGCYVYNVTHGSRAVRRAWQGSRAAGKQGMLEVCHTHWV
jgi:hypothetical protein